MILSYCSILTVTHRLMVLYSCYSRQTFWQLATSKRVRVLVCVCALAYVLMYVCFVSDVGNESAEPSVLDV
jgi:hypothetical protein